MLSDRYHLYLASIKTFTLRNPRKSTIFSYPNRIYPLSLSPFQKSKPSPNTTLQVRHTNNQYGQTHNHHPPLNLPPLHRPSPPPQKPAHQKKRLQCVEWALYHLFALWDPEETRNVCPPQIQVQSYSNTMLFRNFSHSSLPLSRYRVSTFEPPSFDVSTKPRKMDY